MNKVIAGLLGFFAFSLPQGAAACGIITDEIHRPSCTIPEPTAEDSVSLLAVSGPLPSASVHVGSPTDATSFATVNITPSDKRHYLVLDSYGQIIWNIQGDTDSVSRVIVLGPAGVIGVPKERIFFAVPDLTALNAVHETSCTRKSYACSALQWFEHDTRERITFHPEPTQGRLEADAFVGLRRGGFGFPGTVIKEAAEWPVTIVKPTSIDTPVEIDPARVVSPRPAETYNQPTGQAGMARLSCTCTVPADRPDGRCPERGSRKSSICGRRTFRTP
jgi:hypothetical protein